jgi:Tol biopolymer transport system component
MKNQLRMIFILILGLSSCSVISSDDPAYTEQHDYLVYLVDNNSKQRQLFFYDPINDIHTSILSDWEINDFSVSISNRLAFSSFHDGYSNIYVLDYPFTENVPISITSYTSSENTPFSWSPDGRYLAFESFRVDEKILSIWDGDSILDIHKYQEEISGISWSLTDRLAFTEFYTFVFPYEGDPSEVFIWDGNTTVSVSQNPTGEDRSPAWSEDGQLAFLSNRNGEYDIFVWDGISENNGQPNIKSFTNVASELTQYFSSPTWTNNNTIAFVAGNESDVHVQVYEWNGQSAKNISQNPPFHNGGQTWRNDGYWAFVTFFSSSQNLYIRDDHNQTVLETKGQYLPAWSRSGLLAFCVPERPNWTLSIWNGKDVVKIAHGGFIMAKWSNGEYVLCSSS